MGIAEEKGYDQSYGRIDKIRYSHDAMIDLIIQKPEISQNELATVFGYSVPWVSRVYGSDAFQARLEERRAELVDPVIRATLDERMKGLMIQSIDVISEKLAATSNADMALKALDITTKALGFGARDSGAKIQNNFVVQLPVKSQSAEEWAKNVTPTAPSLPRAVEPDGGLDING